MIPVILLLGLAAYFFLGVYYSSLVANIIISAVFMIILFLAYRKSNFSFMIVLLSSVFIFISLIIAFGGVRVSDSPLAVNLVLGEWIIFLITLIISGLFWLWYEKSNYKNKYPLILLILFLLFWGILAFNVKYFGDWKMENYLNIPFIIILFLTFSRFRFSNISYTTIFIFMAMNVIGSHYTYAEVPFGFWLADVLGVARNHYDRIVHFSFGLLFAYPIREISVRIANFKGVWGFYFPVDVTLAFACIYELIEWGIAVLFGGDLGVAYLGTQGDVWDAQKDMILAGIGSIITMMVTAGFVWYYHAKGFIREFRESMEIKQRKPLGERVLSKWIKKK